jgi:hypothetical protein
MFGTKSNYINLEFRTIEEVLADKYISKEAKYATKIKHQLQKGHSAPPPTPTDKDFKKCPFVEELSTLTIEDDERKDTAPLLQPIPEQQKSDD